MPLVSSDVYSTAGETVARVLTLQSSVVRATFSARGLSTISLLAASAATVHVSNDAFRLSVDGKTEIMSNALPTPSISSGASHVAYTYHTDALTMVCTYTLRQSAAFVTKTLAISPGAGRPPPLNATNVTLFSHLITTTSDGALPSSSITARSSFGLGDYALFRRWPAAELGLMLTAQNPYLALTTDAKGSSTLTYAPMVAWPSEARNRTFVSDAAHLGLHKLTHRTLAPPDLPLDQAEHSAMIECVRSAIASPPRNRSVKINVGWTEDDYQIDISTAGGRAEYKRIIVRLLAMHCDSLRCIDCDALRTWICPCTCCVPAKCHMPHATCCMPHACATPPRLAADSLIGVRSSVVQDRAAQLGLSHLLVRVPS